MENFPNNSLALYNIEKQYELIFLLVIKVSNIYLILYDKKNININFYL